MTAADDDYDPWAGVDATPALSSINPFDHDTSPELHAAWTNQDQAQRDADRRAKEAIELADATERALLRRRADKAAQIILRGEDAAAVEMPELIGLGKLLAEDDEPVSYRVDGLWPTGGRVILAAQFKAGKTTLRDNLVRSLADETPFLGRYAVAPIAGTIIIFDTELSRDMLRRWLRAQHISATSRVLVVPMRGRLGAFDLRDDAMRARWVEIIRDNDGQIIILDCLAPVLTTLGLDPNQEAGAFLDDGLDPLLRESGASEALITHHMGHVAERSRGDSRIRDWPDVEWRLLREKEEENPDEPAPAAPRYFTAYGRDVEVGEQRLNYDFTTKTLTLIGGNRRDRILDLVIDAVRAAPGINVNAVCKQIQAAKAKILEAKDRAVAAGLLRVENGPNRTQSLYVVSVVSGSSEPWVGGGSVVNKEPPPLPPSPEIKNTKPLNHETTDPLPPWAADIYDREA